jgi:hypothetical protein
MRRVRTAVAIVVAVGMLSLGGAACTPQQAADFPEALGDLLGLVLTAFLLTCCVPPIQCYGCGLPPTTVTVPATIPDPPPEPVGT